MIKEYLASPKRFSKPDFNKIGTGTGVLRYAFGLYMGEKNTALKYYEDYREYGGADVTFVRNGIKIKEDSLAFEVATILKDAEWDIQQAEHDLRLIKGPNESYQKAFKLLTNNGTRVDFQTSYAAFYEVTIPGYSLSDLVHWDHEISNDELDRIALAYNNKKFDMMNIPQKLADKVDALGVDLEADSVEELIDDLFDKAIEYAIEEDLIPMSLNEEDLREIWYQKVRNDFHSINLLDNEFDEAIDDRYLDALKDLVDSNLIFENEMKYGDMYQLLAHAFVPDCKDGEDNVKGKKLASDFLSKELGYIGFIAESKFGDYKAQEKIVINESVADKMKLVEMGADMTDDFEDESDFDY